MHTGTDGTVVIGNTKIAAARGRHKLRLHRRPPPPAPFPPPDPRLAYTPILDVPAPLTPLSHDRAVTDFAVINHLDTASTILLRQEDPPRRRHRHGSRLPRIRQEPP